MLLLAVVGVVVVQVFRNENVNFSGEYRVCFRPVAMCDIHLGR